MAEALKLTEATLPETAEEPGHELLSAVAIPGSTVVGLFKSHARRVRSFLRWRLRNDDDAQDAAQEVFLKLWRREKEGALEADAAAYMGSAVHNAAIDVDRWRAYRRPADHFSIDDIDIASSQADPSDALFWRDALHRFTEVLNDLPDLTQRIFVLYHVEGHTHTAISKKLGVTVRTVERHMARAIAHCEERMKDYL